MMMRNAVITRRIELLYHFTKVQNLDSIMTHGIMSRTLLDSEDIGYEFNDNLRIDGQRSASCFSVEHPNYKMFYYLRQLDKSQEWVVLGITRNVLWENDCAFCWENAASADVISTPINQRKGVAAFEKIFDPINGKPSRNELRLTPKFPTNPQAEVLVFDTVIPEHILLIITETVDLQRKLSEIYKNVRVQRHQPAFYPRFDYAAWK